MLESLAFGQEWDGDTRIVLLVRLVDGAELDDELVAEIKRPDPRRLHAASRARGRGRGRRPAPHASGKLVELAVGDAVNGRPVRNTTALANPEALDHICDQIGRAAG